MSELIFSSKESKNKERISRVGNAALSPLLFSLVYMDLVFDFQQPNMIIYRCGYSIP